MASVSCFSVSRVQFTSSPAGCPGVFWPDCSSLTEQEERAVAYRARPRAAPIRLWLLMGRLNAANRKSDPIASLVLLDVRLAQALADCRPRPFGFAAGHGIGAIIGGVEGARPVVAGQPDAPEGRIRRSAVGRLVPVDHARPDIGPEFVVRSRPAADQARGEPEGRVVSFLYRPV